MSGVSFAPNYPLLKTTAVTFSSSGSNTVLTGVTGQTIRVHRVFLTAATSTNLTFQDGSTNLSGAMNLGAHGQINLSYGGGEPVYVCSSGNNFTILSDTGVQVSGTIWSTIGDY